MDLKQLVDTYFDQIEIEDAGCIDCGGAKAVYLTLRIPIAMVNDYLVWRRQNYKLFYAPFDKLKELPNGELPDGVEFWKKTELSIRLRYSDKYHLQGYTPFENIDDILDFLEGRVLGEFEGSINSKMVILEIMELPKEDDDYISSAQISALLDRIENPEDDDGVIIDITKLI